MARKKPTARPDRVVSIDTKDPTPAQLSKKLSLAQKMGLVPMPPAKLSQEDWKKVATQSRSEFSSSAALPAMIDRCVLGSLVC